MATKNAVPIGLVLSTAPVASAAYRKATDFSTAPTLIFIEAWSGERATINAIIVNRMRDTVRFINTRPRKILPRQPEALRLRLESRAKNFRVQRVGEAVAHKGGVIVLNIHVEFLDVLDEEIQNLAVVGELPPRQHHLIGAFLVELAQPCAFLVQIHGLQPLFEPSNVPYLF